MENTVSLPGIKIHHQLLLNHFPRVFLDLVSSKQLSCDIMCLGTVWFSLVVDGPITYS